MKTIKRTLALFLAVVLAFSCFAVVGFAAPTIQSVRVVQEPTKKTYFKGRDWDYGYWKMPEGTGKGVFVSRANNICFMYNGGYYSKYSDIGMLDMNGLVVEVTYSDGTEKTVTYSESIVDDVVKQNIYFSPKGDFKVNTETEIYVYFKENVAVSARGLYKIKLVDTPAIKGDVNESMETNSSDALIVLQHVVGIIELKGTWLATADVNGDKTVNSADALAILNIAVGKK